MRRTRRIQKKGHLYTISNFTVNTSSGKLSLTPVDLNMAEPVANIKQGQKKRKPIPTTDVSSSAVGAAWLVLNQIGSRALTFVVNQVLLRYLSPGIYGVAIQLELFSVSVLYFSRESLRVTLARQRDGTFERPGEADGARDEEKHKHVAINNGPARRMQEIVNLSHIAIALGLPLTLLFGWLYLRSAESAVLETRYLQDSLYIYAAATIIELLNEPGFAVAKQQMLDGTRAWAEFRASTSRCLVTCGIAIWASRTGRDLGVLPFAAGQLSYAVILNVIYVYNLLPICNQNHVSLLPRMIPSGGNHILSRFPRPLITIAATFYGQAIFNQILTSGDSYLIAALAPLSAQGAYALAANYGGLLARMLFQPIEEASRSLFGRIPSSQSEAKESQALKAALGHLHNILHFYALLSLLATTLGPVLSPLLLRILAGSRWTATEAPAVLSAYCYLIPLLAINGILEAFVSAVATPSQIRGQNLWKVGQLAAFAISSWLSLGVWDLGATGLVVANALTMAMRVGWSWNFVSGYLDGIGVNEGLDVQSMMPMVGSVATGLSSRWALGYLLHRRLDLGLNGLMQIGTVVGFCGVGT